MSDSDETMNASTTSVLKMSKPLDWETDDYSTTLHGRPSVIGLYGIPGCGKSYLMDQLKEALGGDRFSFYEGSHVIDEVVPGGLDHFLTLDVVEKEKWRKCAIDEIKNEAKTSGKTAIVTGHFMFWGDGTEAERVYTDNDLATYTHILYLDVSPETTLQRRLDDNETAERIRPQISVEQLQKWQEVQKNELRDLCLLHSILFLPLSSHQMDVTHAKNLILDFERHNESYNLSQAERKLDEIVSSNHGPIESMLVLDADRTLSEQDTGTLFWERSGSHALKAIFDSPMQYSYEAFRQMALLHEESDDKDFDLRCHNVASKTTMYPEFISLLRLVKEQPHVGVVVITCGLRRVWEAVLEREGLGESVKVIGGGRINDGFVVTQKVKEELVIRLRKHHKTYVWAFGDSPLDLPMLKKANQAIVVVGNEKTRSKTMDAALADAIGNGFHARQTILPSSSPPRLDVANLPVIALTQREFVTDILAHGPPKRSIVMVHATDRESAKLLMTPMRDANNEGPALREAHRRTGMYLATDLVSSVIGIEKYPVKHVQGYEADGFRLFHEKETVIVSLMRGGDPMAIGVSDAFPRAMYLHAKYPEDITVQHLEGQVNLLLVDSVVNSGKSIAEFVQHIRNINATIRIVVIAGVVQNRCISGGPLRQALAGSYDTLTIVALRLSENSYTGSGGTDTGNRLFNTKHLL